VHPAAQRTTTPVQDPVNHRGPVDPVARDFLPDAPNEIRYGEVTCTRTVTGWCHLATVIDAFSRPVIGGAVADHRREHLVLDAPRTAIAQRRPHRGQSVTHTDRASLYTGRALRDLRLETGIPPCVGKSGICFDNATAEPLNTLHKKEPTHLPIWADHKPVRAATFEYIETYHNHTRIQRQPGHLNPAQYETIPDKRPALAA
jgi:putative transposase